ncbi:unnamed protein product [Coregonus sp. 'balchen']|nr:unnamed protein product [Coregonus sp. 'balchen']
MFVNVFKAVQERDNQIKMLTEQVEQYTWEMERNSLLIEELKKPLKKDRGLPSAIQQRNLDELNAKLQATETRAREGERVAELPEIDARDKELSDTLNHMRLYESGTDGLQVAIAEIKECKNQMRVRNREAEAMTTDINQMEMRINDLLDENADLKERLCLEPKEEVDLTEFRRTESLKQRQFKAENQYEHLRRELNHKERELALQRTQTSQFKSKCRYKLGLYRTNKQLEQVMKEILQAIQDTQQKNPSSQAAVFGLERLVHAMMKNSDGKFDASLHLKAQVDQLTGMNDEIRPEMRSAREESASAMSQLVKGKKIVSSWLSGRDGVIFRTLNLPDDMAPSSTEIISSLNEFAIRLLQEFKNEEESSQQLVAALEEYKGKFAVRIISTRSTKGTVDHEKEAWQKERHTFTEMKNKLEEQKEVDSEAQRVQSLAGSTAEGSRGAVEAGGRMTVLRVNEKTLTHRYTTLLEQEQHLRKNSNLNNDFSTMQASVTQRIGYLIRYKKPCCDFSPGIIPLLSGGESSMDKAAKAVSNSEIVSAPGRITMLEMKDQNARQRAASGTPSDEHLRNSLRQVEERNVELETKFTEVGEMRELSS